MFAHLKPEILKRMILQAAEHQYIEGDVMHWWHKSENGVDKGVRTTITDDLLWLPYAVCEYIEKTGDTEILNIPCEYLASDPLGEEKERYETPNKSGVFESIFDHCVKAIELVIQRGTCPKGILKIGGGD